MTPERWALVEGRERVGDWEADTTVGAGTGGAVVSLVDRATKYTLLRRVDRRGGTGRCGHGGPSGAVHTITDDNGNGRPVGRPFFVGSNECIPAM